MSIRLTQRVSFRWLPEPPAEPTDTLVMSVSNWFIDLRITKTDGSLEWGFAGEEKVLQSGVDGHTTYQWTHVIDSQGYTAADIGTLPDWPSGEFLETGKVPHPVTNIATSFEERWRSIPISQFGEPSFAWILQSVDGRTFIGRIGGIFQAMRAGSEGPGGTNGFCARRELWGEKEKSWVVKAEAGESETLAELPSIAEYRDVEDFVWQNRSKGDVIEILDGKFVIRGISSIVSTSNPSIQR